MEFGSNGGIVWQYETYNHLSVARKYYHFPNMEMEIERTLHPVAFRVYNNYPNPFNPITSINYDLPKKADVVITIHDIIGREIVELVNENQLPGYKTINWNGINANGLPVSTGLYFYSIHAGEFHSMMKMIFLK